MGYNKPVEVELDKDICVDINVYENFDFNVDVQKCVDVDVKIESDVCLDGNAAFLNGTVEAIGYNTLAELDFTVTTIEHQLSEVSVCAQSATTGWGWIG